MILVILVMTVSATQAKKQETSYKALKKCQSVRGKVAAEF